MSENAPTQSPGGGAAPPSAPPPPGFVPPRDSAPSTGGEGSDRNRTANGGAADSVTLGVMPPPPLSNLDGLPEPEQHDPKRLRTDIGSDSEHPAKHNSHGVASDIATGHKWSSKGVEAARLPLAGGKAGGKRQREAAGFSPPFQPYGHGPGSYPLGAFPSPGGMPWLGMGAFPSGGGGTKKQQALLQQQHAAAMW